LTVFLREFHAVCAVNMNIWIHYKFTFITVRNNEITRRTFGKKKQPPKRCGIGPFRSEAESP
jgi:hypothetical protein